MTNDLFTTVQLPPAAKFLSSEFNFIRKLGEGGFGQVWQALDVELQRFVAIKLLKLEDAKSSDEYVEMLRHESRLLARLRHPNLIAVHALRRENQHVAIISEFIDGGSLQEHWPSSKNSFEIAAKYIADVAAALTHVHESKIVHCDIKPANILVRRSNDEAVLCDFGLARIDQNRPAGGTRYFTAPEVFKGMACPASDVYSLAATLTYALTNFPPGTASHTAEYIESVRESTLDKIPENFRPLVIAALQPTPSDRPTLQDLAEGIRGSLNHTLVEMLSEEYLRESMNSTLPCVSIECIAAPQSASPRRVDSKPAAKTLRDLKRINTERVVAHTGEQISIRVHIDSPGYLTLLNIGPSGNLNLLEENLRVTTAPFCWQVETVLSPPVGYETLFAIWTNTPFSLPSKSASLNSPNPVSEGRTEIYDGAPIRATRDIVRIKQAISSDVSRTRSIAVSGIDHVS